MRFGQNPAKYSKEVVKPERITVATLTYIPFLSGFYAEGLDVIKICLESLWQSTGEPHDLMVFDNGSCPEVQDYLLDAYSCGKIQYLILSEKNVGKGGAWNVILNGAPGEIIAYGDSDILYYPGWLSKSVEVLETFPNVGMVTSRPIRTPEQYYTSTLKWVEETPDVVLERGQFLSWEEYSSFVLSMGITEQQTREWFENGYDVRTRYQGVTAYLGASHWQFVAYKSVLQQFLPFNMDRPMGQVRQLDERLNEAGYLRLMIDEPLVQNMSNTVPEELRSKPIIRQSEAKSSLRNRFFNLRVVKKPLMLFYDKIFQIYYK